ncbi:hypothetical protein [Acidipila sp. EB88]|uniref:hypothetical protein n=1 Tax=Acidipila sp. EB88 TaxID=2305226 RepID=UPI000F5F1FC1|nr:hypothetical protein [Acidipila sp. EB88]RRA50434.1 hypothetical protein D1Y84_00010 [Acidipila sp. EB88]RRA50514.1 hypothetical protein D1Y84_00470 [Acidipila sp. EB88]
MSSEFNDIHQAIHEGLLTEYFENGHLTSTDVHFQDQIDVFTADGLHQTVRSNAMGGHDVTLDGQVVERSIPDGHGHTQLYTGEMHPLGSLSGNVHGGHDLLDNAGVLVSSSIPHGGGFETVMHFEDPLVHSSDYNFPDFIF